MSDKLMGELTAIDETLTKSGAGGLFGLLDQLAVTTFGAPRTTPPPSSPPSPSGEATPPPTPAPHGESAAAVSEPTRG